MKEQLKEQLMASLGEVLTYVKAGAAMVGEQVPLILKEIIVWSMAQSAVGVIGLGIGAYLCCRMAERDILDGDASRTFPLGMIFGTTLGMFCLGGAIVNLLTFLKVWLAPRVFLIEYLRGMM